MMSGLLLCGKTAKKPLNVKEAEINLYSMEELCYYLYNNIYMIGPEFFDNSLIEFLDNGLELEAVAKKIKDQMYRNESYIEMIKTIIDGSHYYCTAEKENISQVLKELENRSEAERIKARGDLLAQNGRYDGAIRTYRTLLGTNRKGADSRVIGSIWNNMGVIYAKLFLYRDALSCFKLAYDMGMEQEYMDNLICTLILLDDAEKTEEIKLQYEITDEVIEKYGQAIEMARDEIKKDPRLLHIREKLTYSPEKELNSFYKGADQIINMWKNAYREQIK